MKKNLLKKVTIAIALFSFINLHAQMTVTTYGAKQTTINDGDIISFNTTDEQGATLYFYINNNFTEDIDVRIKCNDIVNANGDNFQFCFGGLCIFKITEGTVYPDGDGPVTIPAGGTNVEFDKFFNENNGSGQNYPLDYNFTIYRVDNNDNQIGDGITFTYRYNPNLSTSTEKLNQMGVNISNTISTNEVNLQLSEDVEATFYDLSGKNLLKKSLERGNQSIDISMLNAGIYLIRFKNQSGNSTTTKIIKK